ncbi:hypothetical protein GCM10017774_42640 [Lentzea cavernae]|uniref:Uncharacterized protein n=1 Tax=Lentzea cavernae TaxID=2020703 RepID=A0ABQ3MH92_9PSEU|nr:hypothetical protein GCM10017774_42640 [Lentzea cavernae]
MSEHGFRRSTVCELIKVAVDRMGHNRDRIQTAPTARGPPTGRPAIVSRFCPILSRQTKINGNGAEQRKRTSRSILSILSKLSRPWRAQVSEEHPCPRGSHSSPASLLARVTRKT